MSVWIESELCNGCKRCLKACPYEAITMAGDKAVIGPRCTGCGACLEVCRQAAIKTDIAPRAIPDFSAYRDIWVLVETVDDGLHPVTRELLGEARRLGRALQQKTVALLLGGENEKNADRLAELAGYGAEIVVRTCDPRLEIFDTGVFSHLAAEIISRHQPSILLLGATPKGRDLAPRLARRLQAGLTADCTELAIDPEEKILLQTRPAFGGNLMATIASRYSRPQMATVRPGVMAAEKFPEQQPEVIDHPVSDLPPAAVTQIEIIAQAREQARLQEAKIIVAGGRGTGGENGFKLLRELAQNLGAELAGTRIAVEEGWIEADRQVGQTGQSVRPELYIACGISGAIQHRAGMLNSRYIIAINQDEKAPIFEIADWGIVGDLNQVIPEMISRLTEVQ